MMSSEEPPREDTDFDRDFWRSNAHRSLQEAFSALEGGRLHFGNWERLFLSAAIDHFRDRNFEQASMSAQRIFSELWLPKLLSRRSIALQSGKLLTEWSVF
jgi:hypothetical protein